MAVIERDDAKREVRKLREEIAVLRQRLLDLGETVDVLDLREPATDVAPRPEVGDDVAVGADRQG